MQRGNSAMHIVTLHLFKEGRAIEADQPREQVWAAVQAAVSQHV